MEPTSTLSRGRAPQPPPPDRSKYARLAFEGLLLALCGYLVGVAGIPPLFGPPGQNDGIQSSVASGVVAADTDVTTSDDGTSSEASEQAAAPTSSAQPGEGVTVNIGRANWSTGYFQAAVFKSLLEELGYQVGEPGSNEHAPAEAYALMASGQFDFWTNSWYPNHQPNLDADGVGAALTPVGNLMPASGLEGIVVNTSVAGENQITSLDQINGDPNLVALFDSDGNGKAELHGCEQGWGCAEIINETIQFNGWENIEHVQPEDYTVKVGESAAQVDAGTPVLQYTWSPSGYLTSLRPGDNVQWLSVGGQENVLDGSITPDRDYANVEPPALGTACTTDPCWLGWPAANIQVTARNEFLSANPAARALFEQVQLKVLDVALANVKYDTGEQSEEDIARHAQDWISENRDLVDGWLQAARAAA